MNFAPPSFRRGGTGYAGMTPRDPEPAKPVRMTATPLLRSMLTRAAEAKPDVLGKTLVTEHIDGVCVQCVGGIVARRTLDGFQQVAQFRWFIDCRRSNKAEVFRRFGQPA